MITLSIDVLLLDKARFKEVTLKSGKTAKYCELILIDTPNGKYGDFIVKQGVTKEERSSGVEMPILGNGKILARQSTQAAPQARAARPATQDAPPPDDDVPF